MKDLYALHVAYNEKAQDVRAYYEKIFSCYGDTDLFEVYDIEREEFVQFSGRQGSQVVNKKTLIKNLIELETYHETVAPFIVLEYDKKNSDFYYPVFIGKQDAFGNANK